MFCDFICIGHRCPSISSEQFIVFLGTWPRIKAIIMSFQQFDSRTFQRLKYGVNNTRMRNRLISSGTLIPANSNFFGSLGTLESFQLLSRDGHFKLESNYGRRNETEQLIRQMLFIPCFHRCYLVPIPSLSSQSTNAAMSMLYSKLLPLYRRLPLSVAG